MNRTCYRCDGAIVIAALLISMMLSGCKKTPQKELVVFEGTLEVELYVGDLGQIKVERTVDGTTIGKMYPTTYSDLADHYFKIIDGGEQYAIVKESLPILKNALSQYASAGVSVEYNRDVAYMRKKTLMGKDGSIVQFGVYPVRTRDTYRFTCYKGDRVAGNVNVEILKVERASQQIAPEGK
jgi:hypothetical protein